MSTDPAGLDPSPYIVFMGVTGCGKTTVGTTVAERLGVPFGDADDFHPKANVDKMASGHPLDDEDRWPWLEAIGRWMEKQATGCVVGCSALRVVYRDLIREHCPNAYFVHLHGPMEVALSRVAGRKGHFMPAELVQSQYDTLEDLEGREAGVDISFDQPVADIVEESLAVIAAPRDAR